jgi:ABC-type transport system substrate-binding protein
MRTAIDLPAQAVAASVSCQPGLRRVINNNRPYKSNNNSKRNDMTPGVTDMSRFHLLAGCVLSAALAVAAGSAAAQDRKGTLVVAIDSLAAQNMDPILETRPGHAHYHAPLYDSLVGFNFERGGIGPGVAESWKISDDGTSWNFILRKGQKFHNGDPITAEDVKFSIERIRSEESITAQSAAMRRLIKDIEVVDEHTIRFHTNGILVYFPTLFSRAIFHDGTIMPKKYFEKVGAEEFRKNPVGSGPWKFVRSVPGDFVEYEAVSGHWRGEPSFERLIIMQVPEESTRMAMVRTGEAAIASISPEAISEVRSSGLRLVSVPGTMQAIYQFWGLHQAQFKDSPLNDVRVREALSLAIDRKAIIDNIMEGEAKWPMPFATFGYSLDMDADRWQQWAEKAFRYDPDRARALLAEAGYPNGFELTFANTALPGTPFMIDVGLAVADFWTKVGVKVKVEHYEWGSFRPLSTSADQAGVAGKPSMYRTAGRPIATTRYQVGFHPEGSHRLLGDKTNCPELCKEYVALHQAVEKERDDTKRGELTNQMIEMTSNTWMAVPILEGMGYWAVNTEKVGQFKPIPGRHEFGDVFERMPRPEQKPWQ